MTTLIQIIIDQDTDVEETKPLLADICDVIAKHGLSIPSLDEGVKTIVFLKDLDQLEPVVADYIIDEMETSILTIIPITPPEEK